VACIHLSVKQKKQSYVAIIYVFLRFCDPLIELTLFNVNVRVRANSCVARHIQVMVHLDKQELICPLISINTRLLIFPRENGKLQARKSETSNARLVLIATCAKRRPPNVKFRNSKQKKQTNNRKLTANEPTST